MESGNATKKTSPAKRVIRLVLTAVLAAAALYFYVERPYFGPTNGHPAKDGAGSTAQECLEAGGVWLAEHAECERVGSQWCDERNGRYDACASACRHEASGEGNPVPCTLQCVQVCRLGPGVAPTPADGAANATYTIDGSAVTLVGGRSGTGAPIATRIWGEPLEVDADEDGEVEHVVVLIRDYPDQELRYYVAATKRAGGGFLGTEAIYVGDRIALRPPEFRDGEILVNYTERLPWQDMATRPSVNKTKRLFFDGERLVPVELPVLDTETATRLAAERWGDCSEDRCEQFTVRVVDDGDGVWYVEALHDGWRDDSVRASKVIAPALQTDDGWVLGEPLLEVSKCQQGRGHQDFLDALCV